MRYAVTMAAAVLGSLLGIAQAAYWCEFFWDVLGALGSSAPAGKNLRASTGTSDVH
jgi:hypothetical protein